MKYLTKPCDNCPFKKGEPFPLMPGRMAGIVETLHNDQLFFCHKTTGLTGGKKKPAQCGGALAFMHQIKELRGNVMFRLGLMGGKFKEEDLAVDQVFQSKQELLEAYGDA